MSRAKNTFLLDLSKLEAVKKTYKMNDSDLSIAVGKSRSWMCSIKKRANSNGCVQVPESMAQKIADELTCTLQDIRGENTLQGKRHEKEAWNPIFFDHEAAARGRLEKLLPENAQYLDALLAFLEKEDDGRKDDLMAYIHEYENMDRKKISISADQWWKFIYVYKLSEALILYSEVCTTDQIYDRYYKKIEDISENSLFEKREVKIRFMESVLKNATDDLLDLSRHSIPWDQRLKEKSKQTIREKVLYDCAEILVDYAEQSGSLVELNNYVDQLRSEMNLNRVYFRFLSDKEKTKS